MSGGLDWGADYLPIPAWGQAASLFGAGLLTSVALAKFADTRVAAGTAGGTTAVLIGRLRQLVALSRLESSGGADAVRRGGAGAVYPNAGATKRTAARTMAASQFPGARSMKEAGASYYLRGPARRYGPNAWINRPGAGAVYVSAHNA